MYPNAEQAIPQGGLMGTVEPRATLQKVHAQIDQNEKGLLVLVNRFRAIADHLTGGEPVGAGNQPETPVCGVIDGMDKSMRRALDLREALSYQAQRIEIALGIKSPDEGLPSDAKAIDLRYLGQSTGQAIGRLR